MSQLRDRAESQHRAQPGNVAVIASPTSRVAEAYRSLRSTVKFANVEPPIRTILMADAGTGGQHSAAAANLAAAIALGGDSALLLDANLRRPRLHELFGLPNEHGLAEWLGLPDTGAPLPLVSTGVSGLRLMTAGHMPQGASTGAVPADLLSSDRFSRLISQLRDQAGFVVVDAPALPEFGDALAIAPRVDAVLLLVRSGKTKRPDAQRAREALDRVGARVLGAVLTDVPARRIAGG